MKAFIFVNDNASAYKRYTQGEIPAQFIYGVTQLQKMDFEVKVASGNLVKDLQDFVKYKPDLFFMPFIKRKTLFFFMLAKLFLFKTKFVGWLHLDIFSPPKSKAKKVVHALFLPIIERYISALDSIFFLSEKTLAEISKERNLNPARCHFIRWGGDKEFYKHFQQEDLSGDIISTGRENRDLPVVFNALVNTNIKVDFYTSDTSHPDFYHNIKGDFKINKGFWQYKTLLEKVSVAKAMIIPLRQDKINYCVGLSSLIEAIALGRPVITTYNPYWYVDIEAENIGIVIRQNTKENWEQALNLLANNDVLVREMSANAVRVFNEICDFTFTEKKLAEHINRLFADK
ncbi:UNVERIFIED_ORG: glycosyltransferase involved in cell wall biosynthesis [Kosakonia oryzae]|uniref:Glycosyltransferase involved in cell wall bisynthesis n=1 Tax=Kosakonia radicincitans TaxID=283686 RepID=A0AAX2EUZ3_9ENTR|nr:glycosyltransferase family 1 protein [Kosakonia radicincitans]MDP9567978.1 glycosyltransferase involved in cell wall biosynthesis [Kosakonia oryzae]SFF08753.1 Glycosyltransferase involved in cell wall bisynthesis [Kosakonia radicincitans]SFR20588.1 Glycosyltransferase involved in cell wall bisynthesis [Kosakonia radicincitans]SFT90439.1 Glycosyltransferase involved in cell wall bisynthesis [Kosakonia radicincitans]SFX80102.1 Glycosyltransferase involved in cell wall bisynthesis [Kosakonia r